LEEAKKLGVKYVEGFSFQRLGNEFDDQLLIALTNEQTRAMKAMVEQEGLIMFSSYADAKTRSEWVRYFSIGRKLGLKVLIGEPDMDDLDFIDSLAEVNDLVLALHNHAKSESRYWSPDTVLAAIENRPHLGACVDLGH